LLPVSAQWVKNLIMKAAGATETSVVIRLPETTVLHLKDNVQNHSILSPQIRGSNFNIILPYMPEPSKQFLVNDQRDVQFFIVCLFLYLTL
jgi:hypothetical protein